MELTNTQQPSTVNTVTGQKKKQTPILIIILIVLVVIVAAVLWFFKDLFFKTAKKPTTTDVVTSITNEATSAPMKIVTTNWIKYNSERFQYSIEYPDGWFSVPNVDATDDYKAFSSENVTSIDKLSADGIWLAIHLDKGTEPYKTIFNKDIGLVSSSDEAIIDKVSDLIIDEQKAVKYIYETKSQEPGKYAYVVSYLIQKESSFYVIEFVTFDKKVAEKNANVFDQMTASFKMTQ